jgi:hypothetical protein
VDLSENSIGVEGMQVLQHLLQNWHGWQQAQGGFNLGGNNDSEFLAHPCRSFFLHSPDKWAISQALPISVAKHGNGMVPYTVHQSLTGDLCNVRGQNAARVRWMVVVSCVGAMFVPLCFDNGATTRHVTTEVLHNSTADVQVCRFLCFVRYVCVLYNFCLYQNMHNATLASVLLGGICTNVPSAVSQLYIDPLANMALVNLFSQTNHDAA